MNAANYAEAPFSMPAELVIALPTRPPSTNNLFATVGRKRVRSAEYSAWLQEAGWHLAIQRPPLIAGRVSLLIEVENPKTAIRQDCTNRVKAVEDLLVSHRVIEGDDQRYVREVTVRWSSVEGVRITIRGCE